MMAILLGLAWLGFPSVLTRWILAAANEGDLFITARQVKLDLRGGLDASDVAVYRKGVIGPPFLEARELRVLFRIFEHRRPGETRVKELRVLDGAIRPAWGTWAAPGAGGGSSVNQHVSVTKRSGSLQEMNLDVTLANFDVLGVWVEDAHAALQVDREGVRISRLSGRIGRDLQRGGIEGAMALTRRNRAMGRIITSFDPRVLIPVCRTFYPDAIPTLERFSFPSTPPRLDFEFESNLGDPVSVTVKGRMQAAQYAYRGAGIGFGNIAGEYHYGNGTNRLRLDPFLLVIGGRNASGKTDFDFKAETSDFEGVSAIDLATVLRLAGLKEQFMEFWHLDSEARVATKGQVNFKAPERSLVDATVEGARLGYRSLWANEYSFRYHGRGLTNQFTDIRGKIGGGSVSGWAIVVPGSSGSNLSCRIRAEVIHVDADEFLKILSTNRSWHTEGKLYGNLELSSVGGAGVSGQGQLTLRNAKVLKLALFSGLVGELARINHVSDSRGSQVDAHLSFQLRDGRMESRDIRVEGGSVELNASGSCGMDGSLDFMVDVTPVKKPGLLGEAIAALLSSSGVMEFKLGGTMESPKWKFVRFKKTKVDA